MFFSHRCLASKWVSRPTERLSGMDTEAGKETGVCVNIVIRATGLGST